ncbi:MAG: peptidylprolyl isomerase [Oscillospiraceae bacterium]|nr:peptidylprolyl isomerase [Oscillospiraceae bacterium]
MKITLRLLALVIALCMILACFTGCAKDEPVAPTPEQSTTPVFDDDTLILTIEGSPVYWPEFTYWLNYSLQYCGFVPGTAIDWDAPYGVGTTLEEYILADAVSAVALYRMIDQNAELMDAGITDSDRENISTIMKQNEDYFESKEEYRDYLSSNYLSEELMEYLLACSCKYYNIFAKMFGENGEEVSDTAAIAFGTENNYYRAKHILMSFTNDEGVRYSSTEIEEKYALLEDILNQIKTSDDPKATFDILMAEYSEDRGLIAYPSGYQYIKGDMVEEFQAAVESLDDYGISNIVTMGDYGYTIIMRLPIDPDEAAISDPYGSTLRYHTANHEYEALANTWALEANIEYSDMYNNIDLAAIFD